MITNEEIVNQFNKHYHRTGVWQDTRWLGLPVVKNPCDLWIYQEIIHEVRPDIIIETGTYLGGSALFMAEICQLLNYGRVITVDITDHGFTLAHPRITYFLESSTSPEFVKQAKEQIKPFDRILVVLDSDHSKEHVLNELRIYGELVTKGSYLIVEDTNVGVEEVGPRGAVKEFLIGNKNFTIDKSREKFLLTFNLNGYLKKLE